MQGNNVGGWIPTSVEQSLENLYNLKSLLDTAYQKNPFAEDVSSLSNWLIVRSCGHIETTEKACIGNLYDRLYGTVVYDYLIDTSFGKGRNPHTDNLSQLLRNIAGKNPEGEKDQTLKKHLKLLLDSKFERATYGEFINRSYGECLNALVKARNSLIHGAGADRSYEMAVDGSVIAIDVGNWYLEEFTPKGKAHQLLENKQPSI